MRTGLLWFAVALTFVFGVAAARADYDVRVDLKNVSGEEKVDWPVILRVYTVLGRNLSPGSVNPEGFHVYDASGKEVPHTIEKLPPYDQPGNDELVFVVPRMKPDEVLSYRVTNTSKRSSKRSKIDVVGSPHNLIADGDFEGVRPAEFTPPAKVDRTVAHTGKASLMLTADNQTVSTGCAKPVALHKDSWYYFGVWSKTNSVSRFGYQANGGGYVKLSAVDPESKKTVPAFGGSIAPQCSTRDWLKTTFESRPTDWGMDRYVAKAARTQARLEFDLRQRRHFYMEKGKTRGTWWLDGAVLMEQPEVNVRFDLALKPLIKDGAFLFTRPPLTYLGKLDDKGRVEHEWCGFPYAHEKLTKLDKFALKGQYVSYCVGIYHTREISDVVVRLPGGALTGPGGAKLPVEIIEYCPGYVGAGRSRWLKPVGSHAAVEPVTLAGDKGVRYFFLTFHVPADAKPGRYTGKVEVLFQKDKPYKSVPVALRVQDMVQPTPQDVFVGIIYQGNNPRFDDEGMKVYSRSGFNCLTRFGGFLGYKQDEKGVWQVDLEKLDKTMTWLKGYGMSAVCVFSDFDLGPKWNGGSLLKRVRPADFNKRGAWTERLKSAEQAYKAQIKRIEAARKKHPEWPEFIYMTWDEPNLGGGRNGKPDPAMAWVNQVAPDALTTLDVQFDPLPHCLKWYTVPAFDDPASWAGPEVYRWIGKQGKSFGFCGSAREEGDSPRYQAGMMMIATGAKFFHAWHLGRPQKMARNMAYDGTSKRVLRAVSMINWGDGLNDLKAHCLLRQAVTRARKSADPRKRAAAKAAEEYLRKIFAVWNGDHKPTWPNEPYLGNTADWGAESFYDQWQEQMLKHAGGLMGIKWVE